MSLFSLSLLTFLLFLDRNLIELDRHHMCEVIREAVHVDEHKHVWPSHDDVVDAFGEICCHCPSIWCLYQHCNGFLSAVFDQEGLGFIPVQQLKRFLLQAQLGFQDEDERKFWGRVSGEH